MRLESSDLTPAVVFVLTRRVAADSSPDMKERLVDNESYPPRQVPARPAARPSRRGAPWRHAGV